jgi:hypothetical protein
MPFNRFAKGRRREKAGVMNRTEAAYAAELQLRERCGEIAWWKFEGIKLRLADNTFYTPDFFVMLPDGEFEAHETKGTTKATDSKGVKYEKPYVADDGSTIKIKIAAEVYPIRFFVVFKSKQYGWILEPVGK